MSGAVPDAEIEFLLRALLKKGECVEEIVGAAQAMRAGATRVHSDAECIDTCGTGGDGISTFNVSTTAAIIASAAGAVVAKHGNRSTTRASGSTEVLTGLGINVEADLSTVERCLNEIGIAYLNARMLHPAMKRAASARRAIPGRTTFNLLGPLTNPAGARRQVLGVPNRGMGELIAGALLELGTDHAWVVRGDDGLGDLTVTSETQVVEICGRSKREFQVCPEEVGLGRHSLETLRVDSPKRSAEVVLEILSGVRGGPRDHALLNAGAALLVAGKAMGLKEGVARASEVLDNGAALAKLNEWRALAGVCGER